MITAQMVNELRNKTGAGIMACKKALVETNGNIEEAITLLRKKGEAKAAERSDRETSEGRIFVSEKNGNIALIGLTCETDFVAKNDQFEAAGNKILDLVHEAGTENIEESSTEILTPLIAQIGENMKVISATVVSSDTSGYYIHSNGKLGAVVTLSSGNKEVSEGIAMHITAMNPKYLRPTDVTDAEVEHEKSIWAEQLKNEGKPEQIIANIMQGKEKKFREESALLSQPFVRDDSVNIEQYAANNGTEVTSFARISLG